MKDTQNITILMLLVTAAILSAMLVGTYVETSQSADAEAFARHMGFIVATGRLTANAEAMYIIDLQTKRLNTYFLNSRNNTIEFLATVDLERVFQGR